MIQSLPRGMLTDGNCLIALDRRILRTISPLERRQTVVYFNRMPASGGMKKQRVSFLLIKLFMA